MSWERIVPENWMLKGQREKLGLSQEEVATKAGITLEQYKRYEENGVNISSSTLRIVSAVLEVLELDPSSFAKGEYGLEPLPEDDPLQKFQGKI